MRLEEKLYQEGREVPFPMPFECRIVSEFDETLLVARKNGEEVEFITFSYDCDRQGVCFGHYGLSFEDARTDFAVRSGLLGSAEMLSNEQKMTLKYLIERAISEHEMVGNLKHMESVLEKINEGLSDISQTFNPKELGVIYDSCYHYLQFRENSESYNDELESVLRKISHQEATNGVLSVSDFTEFEIIVLSDACSEALDEWENESERKECFYSVLSKVSEALSMSERPPFLEYYFQAEPEPEEDWDEQEEEEFERYGR
ncbi:MAG: hypothetical protein R3Y07_02105 [Eubacteriales bacterium]